MSLGNFIDQVKDAGIASSRIEDACVVASYPIPIIEDNSCGYNSFGISAHNDINLNPRGRNAQQVTTFPLTGPQLAAEIKRRSAMELYPEPIRMDHAKMVGKAAKNEPNPARKKGSKAFLWNEQKVELTLLYSPIAY